MTNPGITTRWAAWAAATCSLAGAVVPFVALPDLLPLRLVMASRISPVAYVLSWFLLSFAPSLAALGFLIVFARRNRGSSRAALITMALFALYPVPLVAGIIALERHIGM